MSPPSRKRARIEDDEDGDQSPDLSASTESDSGSSQSAVRRDKYVWLSDGNIIVIADNKVAFRVHKSILSLRSEIFSGLFALPDTNAATGETMDGHPVVHVSDSPKDIRRLFLVLCCGKNYYYNRDVLVAVPFAVLSSLVRMAHKYAVPDVLADALSRLKRFYTHDLAAWQDPDARLRYVTATEYDAPEAVALARLTNTPLLLPAAYLECVPLATQYWVQPDSTVVSPIAALSIPEQAQLVQATACLNQWCATRVLGLLAAVPCARCTSAAMCKEMRESALELFREKPYVRAWFVSDEHALKPLTEEMWTDEDLVGFCASCRGALQKADRAAVKALWKLLPRIFDVELDKDVWRNGDDSEDTDQ